MKKYLAVAVSVAALGYSYGAVACGTGDWFLAVDTVAPSKLKMVVYGGSSQASADNEMLREDPGFLLRQAAERREAARKASESESEVEGRMKGLKARLWKDEGGETALAELRKEQVGKAEPQIRDSASSAACVLMKHPHQVLGAESWLLNSANYL